MVKTRKQSKQTQPTNATEQPIVQSAKKQRKVKKNKSINKEALRQKLKSKIPKERRQSEAIKCKFIDFNNKEFQSIIGADKFHCPICLEIMIFPVVTHCGHAFCLPCIEQSLKHKNVCSLCRQPVSYQHFRYCKLIQNLIRKVHERSTNSQEQTIYRNRINQFNEKDKERKIDTQIEVGEFVDFYQNKSWVEGTILQIDNNGPEPILKIVATQRQSKTYQFKLSSRLVARHRYFTKENTLFRDLMGQFRLQISGFGNLPIFQNLINVQINPMRSQMFENSRQQLIRFTFSVQP